MAPASESSTHAALDVSSNSPKYKVEPNIQDAFLNQVRREKLTVTVRMMDGSELEGRVRNFDRFAVLFDHAGADHLIFKHAIAAIQAPKPIGG